jgi:hypothetical protein
VADFSSFLPTLGVENAWETVPILTIQMIELPNCLVNRLSHLISLTKEGGLPNNPILIDDTSDADISEKLDDPSNQQDDAYHADDKEYLDISNEILMSKDDDDNDNDVVLVNESDFEIIKKVHLNNLEAPLLSHKDQKDHLEIHNQDFQTNAGENDLALAKDDFLDSIVLPSVDDDDDLFSEEEEEEVKSLSDIVAASLATKNNNPHSNVPSNQNELNEDFIEIAEEDYLTSSNSTLAPLLQKLESKEELVKNDILNDYTVSADGYLENLELKMLESTKRELSIDLEEDAIGTYFNFINNYLNVAPKKIRT